MARILVVDDDKTDQLFLSSILRKAGHEVFVAREGEQAYKTFLRMGIELVVTDLNMPNVDGLDLIKGLLALFPDAPIIAVSGKGPTLLAEAVNMGVRAGLHKPVDPAVLIEAVEKAVSG